MVLNTTNTLCCCFCFGAFYFHLYHVAVKIHPRNSAHEDYKCAAALLYGSKIMWFLEDPSLMCKRRNMYRHNEDGAEWKRRQSGGKEKGPAAYSHWTVLASLRVRGSPQTFTNIMPRNKEEVKLWEMRKPICLIHSDSRHPVQPTHFYHRSSLPRNGGDQARCSELNAYSWWGRERLEGRVAVAGQMCKETDRNADKKFEKMRRTR